MLDEKTYQDIKKWAKESVEYDTKNICDFDDPEKAAEIYETAMNPDTNGLFAIVSGPKFCGKSLVISAINRYLTDETWYKHLDGSDTCTMMVMADTLAPENGGHRDYLYFKPNHLYILNGVAQFVNAARQADINDGSPVSYLRRHLSHYTSQVYIILEGTDAEIEDLFALDERIAFQFGRNRIKLNKYNSDLVFKWYLDGLDYHHITYTKEQLNIPSFKGSFENWLVKNSRFIPYESRELALYLSANTHMSRTNKNMLLLPKNMYNSSSARDSLKNMTGLEDVKKLVAEFEKLMLFRKKAEMKGMQLPEANMHMLFTGNPGTGKTTVARVIGDILYDLGILKEHKFKEVAAQDLIAEYLGQTAVKTAAVVQEALGGILFIDEAYAISGGSDNNQYASECIAVLVKAMEDHKDDLVIIYAGYEKEMHQFVKMNSGLESRLGFTFPFNDYGPSELRQMYDAKMEKAGFTLAEGVDNQIYKICEAGTTKENFGNGRFVDNIIRRTIMNHASNISEKDEENFAVIHLCDVPTYKQLGLDDPMNISLG